MSFQIENGVLVKYIAEPGETKVVIPDGVTEIEIEAFSGCGGLTEVVIPNGVTNIGEGAFSGCEGLEKIVIPDCVTIIGDMAFYGCAHLKRAAIPDSVTDIGDRVFEDCLCLEEIEIPDSVTSIGDSAFDNCQSLKTIVLPGSVTSIGEYTFSCCTALTAVVLPNSVTSIGRGAFSGCIGLQSMVIPDGVASITYSTFEGCTGLTEIVIPDGVTYIACNAFFGCTALTSVNISVQTLRGCEDKTIWRCAAIPEDETAMRSYCTALSSCPPGVKPEPEEKLLRSSPCAAAEYFERRGRFADYAAAHAADPDALWDSLMSRDPDADLAKLCTVRLFREFLQKREYTARAWRETILGKPVPAALARLLVWQQGKVTFTLDAGVPVNVHGHPVELGDGPIILAHPMELAEDTVKAWQDYFTANRLTQPFTQMREPVLDSSMICPDRYDVQSIASQLLENREKHGITVEKHTELEWYEDRKADMKFTDCTAEVIEPAVNSYKVLDFRFETFTRQVNHIAVFLDSLTARDRILKDDVSIRPCLEYFDLPQILELIDLAAQHGCPNVTAMLQQYKRDRFGSADPTARFSLES